MTSATAQQRPGGPDEPSTTAARLLEAAAGAFAAKGFHATTTRDIASRAGLSPAGVYVHFSSKEQLLHALSAQGHGQALAVVRDAAATSGSPTDRLAAVMRAFSAWHAEHHAVASVVQYEFPHLTPAHRDEVLGLRKQIDEVVRDLLREGRADGSMTVDDVRDTALALMSMCIDVARWYSPHIARTPAQIGETYAALGPRLVGARQH
ncbi:TetR/AcrR family transcriptional regulator [Lapillicoccus jejuensis]|uniref:TetR family transcriptional regulator n=1 Tax=Lapillicoccus jejuensis TaxID=402171 RepID=A0A542DVL9_9MICO|nr:TetR/AcrR family transcriptional regulator [Lapillicoccus jejuensis]TQJ07123.1 TetR family transcriptional regulator [Lapillicoccus jejuensis]